MVQAELLILRGSKGCVTEAYSMSSTCMHVSVQSFFAGRWRLHVQCNPSFSTLVKFLNKFALMLNGTCLHNSARHIMHTYLGPPSESLCSIQRNSLLSVNSYVRRGYFEVEFCVLRSYHPLKLSRVEPG